MIAAAGALARLVQLVVDADVEQVCLVGRELVAVLGALCWLSHQHLGIVS